MMILPFVDEGEVVEREEVVYACGCTTVRTEYLSGRRAVGGVCGGHGERVVRVVKTVEYMTAGEVNAGERNGQIKQWHCE